MNLFLAKFSFELSAKLRWKVCQNFKTLLVAPVAQSQEVAILLQVSRKEAGRSFAWSLLMTNCCSGFSLSLPTALKPFNLALPYFLCEFLFICLISFLFFLPQSFNALSIQTAWHCHCRPTFFPSFSTNSSTFTLSRLLLLPLTHISLLFIAILKIIQMNLNLLCFG